MVIQTGISLEKQFVVREEDLAVAMKSGTLPVLATPALAAFMECTASELVQGHLEDSLTTVGAQLNLSHLAPTLAGKTIICRATLTEASDRIFSFAIEAKDDCGVIGTAEHKRVSVCRDKFMDKARKRTITT